MLKDLQPVKRKVIDDDCEYRMKMKKLERGTGSNRFETHLFRPKKSKKMSVRSWLV